MEQYFQLYHLALYAKGWYKKFNPKGKNKTIWDDLRKIMTADGYWGETMTISDIVNVSLNHFKRLPQCYYTDLNQILFGIAPSEIWKSGYYTKNNIWMWSKKEQENLPEYDYYTAIMYYILSSLGMTEIKNFNKELPKPDYKNCLPRPNGIKDNKLKIFGLNK